MNVLRGNEQQRLAFDEFRCISATPLTLSSAGQRLPHSCLVPHTPDNGDGQLQDLLGKVPDGLRHSEDAVLSANGRHPAPLDSGTRTTVATLIWLLLRTAHGFTRRADKTRRVSSFLWHPQKRVGR